MTICRLKEQASIRGMYKQILVLLFCWDWSLTLASATCERLGPAVFPGRAESRARSTCGLCVFMIN